MLKRAGFEKRAGVKKRAGGKQTVGVKKTVGVITNYIYIYKTELKLGFILA